MNLTFKKASLDDLELLTETRIDVLLAANGLPEGTDMDEVRKQTRRYYQTALPQGTHTAYLVLEGDRLAGLHYEYVHASRIQAKGHRAQNPEPAGPGGRKQGCHSGLSGGHRHGPSPV